MHFFLIVWYGYIKVGELHAKDFWVFQSTILVKISIIIINVTQKIKYLLILNMAHYFIYTILCKIY